MRGAKEKRGVLYAAGAGEKSISLSHSAERHLLMDMGLYRREWAHSRRLICTRFVSVPSSGETSGRHRDARRAIDSRRRTRHSAALARSVRQARSAVVGALPGRAAGIRSSPAAVRGPLGLCRSRSGRHQDQ